ncbi:probable polygalacturonase At3g15720 isoform X2 [Cicer arietinum]|uniref:probable polygalacturonase At3g15720 isoform X2 n=1 Tax=Cicer arietinum TaxID=3827 RepID=UPI003CC605D7
MFADSYNKRFNPQSILEGNIIAPSKEALKDKSYWIRITSVNGLTIDGHNSGSIDGYGSTWWECRSCARPIAVYFNHCNNLTVNNLRVSNSAGAHIAINGCNGATFSRLLVDAPRTSPNTDGFNIASSKNILIQDSKISTGDDCIAINGGSSYINATRLVCGPGHGISIGLGKDHSYETVEEVHVHNCTFIGTTNGARIKTFLGGSGYARKITFDQIYLQNVRNPIIIDQHYGVKGANANEKDSYVEVSEVTYHGIDGTSASDIAIKLDCSSLGCSNIVMDQINIVSSQKEKKVNAFCQNLQGTIESTVPKVSCT